LKVEHNYESPYLLPYTYDIIGEIIPTSFQTSNNMNLFPNHIGYILDIYYLPIVVPFYKDIKIY